MILCDERNLNWTTFVISSKIIIKHDFAQIVLTRHYNQTVILHLLKINTVL